MPFVFSAHFRLVMSPLRKVQFPEQEQQGLLCPSTSETQTEIWLRCPTTSPRDWHWPSSILFPAMSLSPFHPTNPCPGPETSEDWGLWQVTHAARGTWDRFRTKSKCLDDHHPNYANKWIISPYRLIIPIISVLSVGLPRVLVSWDLWSSVTRTSLRTKSRLSPWDLRPPADFSLVVIHPSSSLSTSPHSSSCYVLFPPPIGLPRTSPDDVTSSWRAYLLSPQGT
jgi:hypothetical protein